MSSFDDYGRRLAAVEAELPLLRAEAVATRALAAGADQDVADVRSELRAHTRMLNALRETQVAHYNEHKADAAELKTDVGQIKTDVTGLKTDVGQIKTDVSELIAGMAHIVGLLEGPSRPANS